MFIRSLFILNNFMIRILKLSFFISLLSLGITCKEPYDPSVISSTNNFLVVEGIINLNAPTTIKLSRTTQLKDTSKVQPENNAVLNIEDEQNNTYFLSQQAAGIYILPATALSAGKKYRLRIKTTSSSEYLSDYVEVMPTPEIDSINYKVINNGVQFYANTHDPENKTRYYRWEYEETWKYNSAHYSSVQYSNADIEHRPLNNMIYFCYRTGVSNNIILGSSANLTNDIITDGPVTFVPAETGKVAYAYNILVKQYALTEDAYEYWQNLKKNTEQLGTIFDAQPSLASGNIHCLTNPEEPVIGYLSASSVTSKRFHFENRDLPIYSPSYVGPPSLGSCLLREIFISPRFTYASRVNEIFSSGLYIPVDPIAIPGVGIIGYTYATNDCVDCRIKGGTTVKPSYWP
jgi:hypothetical protein